MTSSINIFWFRRDLRWEDNVGLYHALNSEYAVMPIFIFDTDLISQLPKDDARITFIYDTLQKMRRFVNKTFNSSLALYHGKPLEIFQKLCRQYHIDTVYTNHDYEPYARSRDTEIENFLKDKHIALKTYKDHVIFEKSEVVKKDGNPYRVYTAYMKMWRAKFNREYLNEFKSNSLLSNLVQEPNLPNLDLNSIGFMRSTRSIAPYHLTPNQIQNYEALRDIPSEQGTTRVGPHLRFGTISIRALMRQSLFESEVYCNELIWREFFMQILWHFPRTVTQNFKTKYDRIEWRNNKKDFKAWCEGNTGYPLVDAGMRELNETGFMHNRVRMLVGSFLCKHLLIDWRWGEAYFAEKLHDYEMASNVGNWQWVAGCGVDASPYFRIFNPTTQIKKFDKSETYIKTWVPEYQSSSYPSPIIAHKEARERCLLVYRRAINQKRPK